jgi:hypothetical protein
MCFPGSSCGVPSIVGHYLIQSVPLMHGLIALDISNSVKTVEGSRLILADKFMPHWTGWDARTQRLAVTGYGEDHRLFMVKLNPDTGELSMDTAFHDESGKPGFNFDDRQWPHGWRGSANPHGVVFQVT